jgi:hypothetical protein
LNWEAQAAYEVDHNEHVEAWVKNDHLGFDIGYILNGNSTSVVQITCFDLVPFIGST